MVDVVVLGINRFGERVYDWLCDRSDATVRALLTEADQLEAVSTLQPDLLISAGFRHIVPEDVLSIPDLGAVNLHPSYLPYNRGANPNVWSIVEGTPAGVSIHYMTSHVDAGPLIARRKVQVEPDDDGRDLYRRLERAQVDLFVDTWPAIRDGTAETTEQDPDAGTYHYKQDFVDLFEVDRDSEVRAGDFIDRLRALTFPPYRNAYFEQDGTKYYLELTVTPEDDPRSGEGINWNVPEYTEDDEN